MYPYYSQKGGLFNGATEDIYPLHIQFRTREMNETTTRRVLFAGCTGVCGLVTGCFGISHRLPPDSGEVVSTGKVGDEAWAGEYGTLRIIGRTDGTESFNKSYEVPADVRFEVEPATYNVTAMIDGEVVGTYEWEVTSCRNQLLIDMYYPMEMKFTTSNC